MVTHKDYVAIAQFVRKACEQNPQAASIIDGMAVDLAASFAKLNPRFDKIKFYNACGMVQDDPR